MMDQEKKAQWVAALRSGDYSQGTGVLHRKVNGEHKYCCLGVLCDIALKAGLELRHDPTGDCQCTSCQQDGIRAYDGYDDFLPPKVVQWAGLTNGNPRTTESIPDPGSSLPGTTIDNATLSYLNDNGKTFEEIAAIIERDF
jgi:hypothetical protein